MENRATAMPTDTISFSSDYQRPRKSRRPRPITEHRREQNRKAQKVYRNKQKRYLQQLETFANGAITSPKLPSSEGDESQYPSGGNDQRARPEQDLINCDALAESSLLGFPSNSHHPFGHEARNGVDPSGEDLPRLTPFDPAASVSLDGLRHGINWRDENFAVLPDVDPDLEADLTAFFPMQSGNTYQDMGRVAENNFPSSLENNQQMSTRTVIQAPFSSSELNSALRSKDGVSQRFRLEDILAAGMRTLSEEGKHQNKETPSMTTSQMNLEEGPQQTQSSVQATSPGQREIPDIQVNTLQLATMSFVAACLANAAMLGLPPESLFDSSAQSPFYQMQVANNTQFAHLKPVLQPSTTQLNHPHHPYIDILPFPTFRNRLIQLLQIQPSPFNPAELCQDLKNNGIVCWGSSRGDKRDFASSGTPWDIRSWEIKQWFLRKWWILFDGPDGEMYQHTRWWRELRGESSSYPW